MNAMPDHARRAAGNQAGGSQAGDSQAGGGSGAGWGADVSSGKGMGDENFPVGSLLVGRRLRPHVHAYYAFARAIDDIADSPLLSPGGKLARLDAMGAVLEGRLEGIGRADVATAVRLRASLAETGVAPARATDLLVAFRQDAVQARYASWDALVGYCRHSANPVGRYLLDLHGEGAACHAASDALCTALQVLNHLQDCKADLRDLGRCYLPRDWLAAEGQDAAAVLAERAVRGLRRVFDRVLDEVDRLNDGARRLPGLIACRRMRLEAAAIASLSRRLAGRLRREDPLAGRVRLTRGDAARSLLSALRHLR